MFLCFLKKIRFDMLCESAAFTWNVNPWFLWKKKKKKMKMTFGFEFLHKHIFKKSFKFCRWKYSSLICCRIMSVFVYVMTSISFHKKSLVYASKHCAQRRQAFMWKLILVYNITLSSPWSTGPSPCKNKNIIVLFSELDCLGDKNAPNRKYYFFYPLNK